MLASCLPFHTMHSFKDFYCAASNHHSFRPRILTYLTSPHMVAISLPLKVSTTLPSTLSCSSLLYPFQNGRSKLQKGVRILLPKLKCFSLFLLYTFTSPGLNKKINSCKVLQELNCSYSTHTKKETEYLPIYL